MRQVLGMAATPVTRLVELPGRGITRVWECAGPSRCALTGGTMAEPDSTACARAAPLPVHGQRLACRSGSIARSGAGQQRGERGPRLAGQRRRSTPSQQPTQPFQRD